MLLSGGSDMLLQTLYNISDDITEQLCCYYMYISILDKIIPLMIGRQIELTYEPKVISL